MPILSRRARALLEMLSQILSFATDLTVLHDKHNKP